MDHSQDVEASQGPLIEAGCKTASVIKTGLSTYVSRLPQSFILRKHLELFFFLAKWISFMSRLKNNNAENFKGFESFP